LKGEETVFPPQFHGAADMDPNTPNKHVSTPRIKGQGGKGQGDKAREWLCRRDGGIASYLGKAP
jgi:hypothetical protein